MAYGARLESVLGASPRGFESPILRHRTPGLLGDPGFPLRARCGSAHGERRPRALRPQLPRRLRLGARGAPSRRAPSPWVRAMLRGRVLRATPRVEPRSGERVHWRAVLRVTVSSEPPQGRNAARIRVRCRVRGGSSYSPGHSAPPPVPPGRSPRERAPVPRPSGAASSACAAERHGPRPVPWTVSARGALRRPGRRRPPPRAVRPAAPPARRASRRAGPIRCSSTRWRSGSR